MNSLKIPNRAGMILAFIWVLVAVPDIMASYAGARPSNDISFVPLWMKAVRDLSTFFLFIYFSRKGGGNSLLWRFLGGGVFVFYVFVGFFREIDVSLIFRGVMWVPVLVWTVTAHKDGVEELKIFSFSMLKILIFSSICVSIILGIYGQDMYYEGVGFYQRNPGLFFSPSATAYVACIAFLMVPKEMGLLRKEAIVAGALSLSGIFYIMVASFWGRFDRRVYLLFFAFGVLVLIFVGPDEIGNLIVAGVSGLRSPDAILTTLGTRVNIIKETFEKISILGSFPVGLNVAANQSSDKFFPDNAYLAAIYAFGFVGFLGISLVLRKAYNIKNFGIFLLIFVSGMFYVWFENILIAGLSGLAINEHFSGARR